MSFTKTEAVKALVHCIKNENYEAIYDIPRTHTGRLYGFDGNDLNFDELLDIGTALNDTQFKIWIHSQMKQHEAAISDPVERIRFSYRKPISIIGGVFALTVAYRLARHFF